MRELERDSLPSPLSALSEGAPRQSRGATRLKLAVVGRGRAGGSLARAAELAGIEVRVAGRDEVAEACRGAGAVLLCVPDEAIASVCELIASDPPPLVGHVSGATTLDALASAAASGAELFSIHPLQTFADAETPVEGTPAAIAGSGERALDFARRLTEALGMRPFEVPEENRAAYHAAASIASNLLVALEESATDLLERAGVDDARELLAPLVLRTAANWSERGAAALTGPIARRDRETVERHRAAIAKSAPELIHLYEALAMRAEAVARASVVEVPE
jgi:predicted short-subunit dehydrogenase-like oxidoreductase (DUF2520 family)